MDEPIVIQELNIRIAHLKEQRFHANAGFDEKRVKEIEKRIEALENFISCFWNG